MTKAVYGELAYNFKNNSSLALAFRTEARDMTYDDVDNPDASFDIMGDFQSSYKIAYELHPNQNLHHHL